MPAHAEVIAGRYRIESKLGQGGMGSVWKAQHLTLRSWVAIKLIDPSLASSDEALARFLREAQSAASLRSPHVVQILDHGVDNGVPYIAMELLEGESLADRLDRLGKLSPAETVRVMTHTGRAMTRAHEAGIVHRDLKPDNIFLVRNDDDEIAKVLDFGIAKAKSTTFDVTTGTRTGTMMGTPYYMSPEQVEGSKAIDHRSDLWAMAVIAFECVTGARPFDDETLGALLLKICMKPMPIPSQYAQVPPGFDAWFARAAQRVPAERFQTAREMMDALRGVLTPDAVGAAMLQTPHSGTLGTAKAAIEAATRSGVVLRDAVELPEPGPLHIAPAPELELSSIHPAGVPRANRMRPLLIGLALLALLAGGVLLLGGPSDESAPHLVAPLQPPPLPSPTPVIAAPAATPRTVVAPAAQVVAIPESAPNAPKQPSLNAHAQTPAPRAAPRRTTTQPLPNVAAPTPVMHVSPTPAQRKPKPAADGSEFGF